MSVFAPEKPRLRALLDHFAIIEDPREPWRVAHSLNEVVCTDNVVRIDLARESRNLPGQWSRCYPFSQPGDLAA